MIDRIVLGLIYLCLGAAVGAIVWFALRDERSPVEGCVNRGGVVYLDPQDRFSSCEIPTHRSGG